jgi:hypothetical protein
VVAAGLSIAAALAAFIEPAIRGRANASRGVRPPAKAAS